MKRIAGCGNPERWLLTCCCGFGQWRGTSFDCHRLIASVPANVGSFARHKPPEKTRDTPSILTFIYRPRKTHLLILLAWEFEHESRDVLWWNGIALARI